MCGFCRWWRRGRWLGRCNFGRGRWSRRFEGRLGRFHWALCKARRLKLRLGGGIRPVWHCSVGNSLPDRRGCQP